MNPYSDLPFYLRVPNPGVSDTDHWFASDDSHPVRGGYDVPYVVALFMMGGWLMELA